MFFLRTLYAVAINTAMPAEHTFRATTHTLAHLQVK